MSGRGPTSTTRRQILNWFLSTSGGASLAMMLYPVLRFVLPPDVAEAQSVTSTVAKLGDVPIGSGKVVRFGSTPALVIRQASGVVLAFDARCTHLNCTVQFRADTNAIWCACHNGIFDLTGKNVSGPPPRPLTPLKVNVDGDDIVLTRG